MPSCLLAALKQPRACCVPRLWVNNCCAVSPSPSQVAALKLDELELASLRGDLQASDRLVHSLRALGGVLELPVSHQMPQATSLPQATDRIPRPSLSPVCSQEVSCSLNFDSHTGRGKLALLNPRYSGLRGDSLSGGFRWERDVVRLEKLVLQQQRSRWAAGEDCCCVAIWCCCSSAEHAGSCCWQRKRWGSAVAAHLLTCPPLTTGPPASPAGTRCRASTASHPTPRCRARRQTWRGSPLRAAAAALPRCPAAGACRWEGRRAGGHGCVCVCVRGRLGA